MSVPARYDVDFAVACDPTINDVTRRSAWDRYEVRQWLDAHKYRGLMLRSLDDPMKKRVYEQLCAGLAPR